MKKFISIITIIAIKITATSAMQPYNTAFAEILSAVAILLIKFINTLLKKLSLYNILS